VVFTISLAITDIDFVVVVAAAVVVYVVYVIFANTFTSLL
jgi:hypothetical protein